ncbi:class A beta-lactamase [Bradyrhizobium sp. Tv2a-2]|uniref:class A beta-lactamase n=1 Tax=Bradyrhizobium sp. Tv2a-2 TaxID=113395 RepID=UPI0003F9193B|nr:class A beta-lactamase [Bradyrhizobium sp. Tv2a-2]
MLTRRRFSTAAFATIAGASTIGWHSSAWSSDNGLGGLAEAFARVEADSGGRLGAGVLDTGTGATAGHRQDELFPMCSTFKFLCVAAMLARVDAGKEQLTRRIPVTSADLLDYAPVTKQHAGNDMTVAELCEAAVILSDNTAANLLLASMGGPSAITQYARAIGDSVTRLDRTEPELNTAEAGDPRDTTTPAAMACNLQTLALGVALLPASRDQLNKWLVGCKTGDARLRAGLPKDWRVGDKTGSGAHGTSNDIAVIWPAGRAPIMITAYLTQCPAGDDKRNAAIAAISKAVANAIT